MFFFKLLLGTLLVGAISAAPAPTKKPPPPPPSDEDAKTDEIPPNPEEPMVNILLFYCMTPKPSLHCSLFWFML